MGFAKRESARYALWSIETRHGSGKVKSVRFEAAASFYCFIVNASTMCARSAITASFCE